MKPETRERIEVAVLNLDLALKIVSMRCPARATEAQELVERSMRLTIEAIEKLTAHVNGELRASGGKQ